MKPTCSIALLLAACLSAIAAAQQPVRARSAVVALAEDPALRAAFERGLVAKALENNYDATTTYDIESDVSDLDDAAFIRALSDRGIQFVLMLRPAAVGPGASLESVRNQVSPRVFSEMEEFASRVAATRPNELIAVVHMGIYAINDGKTELLSAGAVWLDEEVENQEEGIARLQDLIVYNVNAVRPAIRRHLGLEPLE